MVIPLVVGVFLPDTIDVKAHGIFVVVAAISNSGGYCVHGVFPVLSECTVMIGCASMLVKYFLLRKIPNLVSFIYTYTDNSHTVLKHSVFLWITLLISCVWRMNTKTVIESDTYSKIAYTVLYKHT